MEGDVRIVQITIRDRQLRKLTAINNEIPEMLSFQNDTFHLYRENSTSTFDFTIPKWYNGKLHDDVRLINDDVYISFIDDDRHYYFYVHTLVQDDFNFILTCNDANLEYTMEQANPFVNSESHNIEWYLKSMDLLELANVRIGLNEISDVTRTLSFDNQETKLERLSSLISQFGGEFDLVTEVDKNGKYSGTRLDIYHEADDTHHGVGKVRGDVTLTYGKDVKGVQVTSDKDGFFNAGIFTGADGLNITDLDKSEKDADGNEEYYTRSGSPMIYAPKSRDKYPSSFLGSDKWTRRDFSTDYKDKNELYAYALRTIKQCSMPQKTYLVSAQSDMLSNVKKLSKGDTVYIYDKNFEGGLLIKARVSEVIKSFTNPMNDTYVFSNYVLINREVSATLQARIDEILASKIPYRIVMVTSNGTSFKNGTGQSIVSPKLFKGDVEITDATYRFNFNNNTVAGLNYTVNASAVSSTSVLKIDAYVGNDVVASDELTFINVNDGLNGSKGADGNGIASTAITYQAGTSATVAPTGTWSSSPVSVPAGQFLWTRTIFTYTDTTTKTIYNVSRQGADGAKGADGIAGKDGVGISSTVITYGLSANETTQPTTWTANPPTLVKGQYLWTKTVWTYTDAKTETGYTKTYIAKDGNNGADGIAGKDGVGIKTTTITYAKSTNGTTAPSSGWTTSVPIAVAGDYIWTKTVWVYTDNTTETGYSVGKIGNTGPKGDTGADGVAGKDGKGITGTVITYGISASETTQPTNWTASVPTLVKGQYLWTKTVWTYTDGKTETGYTKTYIPKDGNNGTNGIAGKDGVGIKSTSITYQASTSGTVVPTGTWSSQVPSVPNGQFLWTRTVWSYTDNTSETGYSVAKMGDTGPTGPKGADGQSSYTHVAYANKSTDVLVDAMSSFSAPSAYGGAVLTSTKIPSGYRMTSTGGTSKMKQTVSFNGTSGKSVYTYFTVKNTHITNDILITFSGIGSTLNANFAGVTIKPGQTYVDYRPAICRDTYNFLQISIGSTAISNDLSYEIYDYALYNTNPFIDFSLDVNPNCRFRGEYQDNNQTASTDPTKYKWVDMTANVKVGGVNLLKGTSSEWKDVGVSRYAGFIKTLTPTDLPNLKVGDFLTFSFDVNTSSSKKLRARLSFSGANRHYFSDDYVMSGTGRVSVSGQVPSGWTDLILYVDANLTATTITTITTEQYKRAKLELGNVATDYSEAPEDTQLKIDSKADQALTQAQMLALEERSALARDNAIAEAMKNTISEVEAKWQTWYNLNTADEKQKVANDIASLFERVAKFEQNLGEASARFEFINNETLIGEEGVAIGDKEGKAKLFLSNDSISFVTNGVAQMTLTGDTLTIKNGLFTERIQIGNYVEEVYDRNPLYNVIRPIKYS